MTGGLFALFVASFAGDSFTVFRDVHVVGTTPDFAVAKNQVVVVTGSEVVRVGPVGAVEIPVDAEVIPGNGDRWLVPGLMNAHAHLPGPQGFDMPLRGYLLLQLAAGVTTLRVMRYEPDHQDLRRQCRDEQWVSPHWMLTAPAVVGAASLNRADMQAQFQGYRDEGYDHVKYLAGLDRAIHQQFVDAAHASGLPVAGHLPAHLGLAHMLRSGQDCIEHLQGYTALFEAGEQELLTSLLAETKQSGVYNCPTVSFYEVQRLTVPDSMETLPQRYGLEYLSLDLVDSWEQWLHQTAAKFEPNTSPRIRFEVLTMFRDLGAPMLVGADDGPFLVPGFAVHEEMKLFEEAGFSRAQVLAFASHHGAAYFGQEKQWGTVAAGMRADLVLLEENPLESFDHLRETAGVMVGGRWHSAEFLEKELEKLALDGE